VHACVPGDDYTMSCGGTNVVFAVQNATTVWGQNVYVVGNTPELGNWDPSKAVLLSPSAYPTWMGKVVLPRNASVALKFIKRDGAGNVVWESGANRVYTIPNVSDLQINATWQP
jgi:alpha-amylase